MNFQPGDISPSDDSESGGDTNGDRPDEMMAANGLESSGEGERSRGNSGSHIPTPEMMMANNLSPLQPSGGKKWSGKFFPYSGPKVTLGESEDATEMWKKFRK